MHYLKIYSLTPVIWSYMFIFCFQRSEGGAPHWMHRPGPRTPLGMAVHGYTAVISNHSTLPRLCDQPYTTPFAKELRVIVL
jgi:hypothetical protein